MKNLREIRSAVSEYIHNLVKPFTEPLGKFIAPIQATWDKLLSPLTNSWQVYKQQHPTESKIIYWLVTITKWFIFLIIAIIFCYRL